MNDRHQIMDDREFWARLEYIASHWLNSSEEKAMSRFWIDGFAPTAVRNTKRGVDIEGRAWVGEGPRMQEEYDFVVSVPQKMLHRRGQTFSIEQLLLDQAQKTLQIEVIIEEQIVR
jgi:hypothetical protein